MITREEFLKQSLLYQMSLGSKELYHSNVWAWLIENDSRFIKVFFPNFDEKIYEIKGVSRECKHRDIIIWLHKKGFDAKEEKYFYVIENKIKSLQSEKQLEDYSENLWDNIMLGGVITGIRNALESNILNVSNKNTDYPEVKWVFVAYENISREIMRIAQTSDRPVIQNHFSQIKEYCEIIKAVYEVIGGAVDVKKNHLDYNCPDNLNGLRLKDVFVKLKGSDFFHFVSKHKNEIECLVPEDKDFHLEMRQSFHNGKATLDFRFTNWQENNNDYLTIGVQIEGRQYRLLIQKNGTYKGQELYDKFKGIWFDEQFDKSVNPRKLFGKTTSLSKIFGSYGEGSGAYVMIYQYYNLNEELNEYERLLDEIKSDLSRAREIVLSEKY